VANALNRPGPLDNQMDERYANRKKGMEMVEYPHPILEPILKETLGIFLYQEQVMMASKVMAGYDDTDADGFRKAMGKKLKAKMEQQREKFILGCLDREISQHHAEMIFAIIEKFAGYGFNKAHAAAYSIIAYRTAYLKAHYPLEFMTAAINTAMTGKKELYLVYIKESRRLGFTFTPPDINKSKGGMVPGGDDTIMLGLRSINKVGNKAILEIIAKQPFTGMGDFYDRIDKSAVNKTVVENLIASGAFDNFGSRKSIRTMYYLLRDEPAPKTPTSDGLSIFGFYISEHPVEKILASQQGIYTTTSELDELQWDETDIVLMISHIKTKQDKWGETMAFLTGEDHTGEVSLVMFSTMYSTYAHTLEVGRVYKMNIKRSNRKGWIVEYLEPISISTAA